MAEAKKNIKGTIASLNTYHTDAYAIAVRNGYQGTEAEWVRSLVGKSAYEIAVINGFKGTEKEWLRSLKCDVGNGDPIVTADAAVINAALANATEADLGKAYLYVGEDTAKYKNGALYAIAEA